MQRRRESWILADRERESLEEERRERGVEKGGTRERRSKRRRESEKRDGSEKEKRRERGVNLPSRPDQLAHLDPLRNEREPSRKKGSWGRETVDESPDRKKMEEIKILGPDFRERRRERECQRRRTKTIDLLFCSVFL